MMKERKKLVFRAMFTCCHVLEDHKPILYISHDEDGDRQFLYGGNHREEDARDNFVSSVDEVK